MDYSKDKSLKNIREHLHSSGTRIRKNGITVTLSFSNFEELHFIKHNLCAAIHELSLYAENEPNNSDAVTGIQAISEMLRQLQNGDLHRSIDKIASAHDPLRKALDKNTDSPDSSST